MWNDAQLRDLQQLVPTNTFQYRLGHGGTRLCHYFAEARSPGPQGAEAAPAKGRGGVSSVAFRSEA